MTFDRNGIDQAFQTAFGRQPEDGEVQYWQDYSNSSGLDGDTLIHYLMKQTRAADGAGQCRDLITRAYQSRLNRAPNDGEVQWWTAQIQAHGPSDTSSDSAAGRDEPFTFTKLVGYIQDQDAQASAASAPAAAEPAPGAPVAAAPQPAPHPKPGFKWPWQK